MTTVHFDGTEDMLTHVVQTLVVSGLDFALGVALILLLVYRRAIIWRFTAKKF